MILNIEREGKVSLEKKETARRKKRRKKSFKKKLTDRHALGVDCAQVGVLEQVHDKVLRRLFLVFRGRKKGARERERERERSKERPTRTRKARRTRERERKPHLLQRQQRLGSPPERLRGHAVGDLSRLGKSVEAFFCVEVRWTESEREREKNREESEKKKKSKNFLSSPA